MDLLSVLAMFGPLAVDLGKTLIGKLQGGEFKPATIGDYIAMRQHDLSMYQAINMAGGTNPSFPWVEAVIRLQRPAVGVIALGTWALQELAMGGASAGVANFAAAVGFYLFGDRTLFYSKQRVGK